MAQHRVARELAKADDEPPTPKRLPSLRSPRVDQAPPDDARASSPRDRPLSRVSTRLLSAPAKRLLPHLSPFHRPKSLDTQASKLREFVIDCHGATVTVEVNLGGQSTLTWREPVSVPGVSAAARGTAA